MIKRNWEEEIGTKIRLLMPISFPCGTWTVTVPRGDVGIVCRGRHIHEHDNVSDFTVMFVDEGTGLRLVSDTVIEGIDFEIISNDSQEAIAYEGRRQAKIDLEMKYFNEKMALLGISGKKVESL